jgi:dihydropteroate synthase
LRKLSVDSFYPQIWIKAVDHYQVGMINSVVGARKKHAPELKKLFSMDPSLSFVAMHMHGEPKSMQDHPLDEIEKVRSELIDYRKNLVAAGCKPQRVWLDPGVGFGKTDSLNFRLIRRAGDIVKNENLLYGVSRKSFLDRWLGIPSPKDRDQVSKGLELGLAAAGVGMIRTHVPQPLCSARNYGVQSL